MIIISVTSYNGASTSPLSGHFDETGGNIGRAENNQLVLPDPERTISRVHAQVVFRNGRYAIVDRGSNPISVNGRPLGNGQETLIQPGDELQIGGYAMRVEAGSAVSAAPADPFADFAGLASGAPVGGGARPPPAAGGFVDPLAAFGMAPQPPPPPRAAPPAAAAPAAGGIPLDWDPFASDTPAPPSSHSLAGSLGRPGAGNADFGLDVGGRAQPLIPEFGGGGGGSGGDSLDALFGLAPGSGGDPLAGSALNAAAAQPNMAAHADPLKSLNSMTKASGQAAADTMAELNAPFMLPPMRVPGAPPPVAPLPVAPAARPAAAAPGLTGQPPQRPRAAPAREPVAPADAVLSWNDASGESRTVIRPRAPSGFAPPIADRAALDLALDLGPEAAAVPAAAPSMAVPPPARPSVAPPARPPVAAPAPHPAPPAAAPAWEAPPAAAAVPARSAAPASSADIAALTAALREGLGAHHLPPESIVLTPAFMHLLGRLVHEATRGTVDLLVARAALKREIRAEVTMIVSRENNPLKFSPSAEVALGHLLGPPARGFMPSDQAMRDAYDDLRAHQFGFLAGMRAALEGILKRFDPAVLESKLTQKSVLASILPAKRKARMWDVFTELYGQISSEASDDFHELFGKEFLRAYNEYIDQLSKERP